MGIKTTLVDTFESQLEEISEEEVGTERHKAAVDNALKFADRIIELEKIESEAAQKTEIREDEYWLKERQLNDEKHDRFIKNCIAIGVPAAELLITGLAFIASMNFERAGNILSTEGGKSSLRALLKFRRK